MVDVLIVGGGLAGLVNAIHLAQAGLQVMLIEKQDFPKHKVCGEYISNEVLPYLQYLGIDPLAEGAVSIKRFSLSTHKGKLVEAKLPLGGFGISRYKLDHLLYQKAVASGCVVIKDTVDSVAFEEEHFNVSCRTGSIQQAKIVIGAFGKRSNLDVKLGRQFIQQQAPYLGVKAHYSGDFPSDLVALHNFKGGYCGVSKVEDNRINICYLADFQSFKKHKNLADFEIAVLHENPHLKNILGRIEPLFTEPITISQVSFQPKPTVENHILMSGDSAGMIHPLCGNGMGMAIHSALLLSELLIQFFAGKIATRTVLEAHYIQQWEHTFRKRLYAGRIFNRFFQHDTIFEQALIGLTLFPALLPFFIRQTHGKTLSIDKS